MPILANEFLSTAEELIKQGNESAFRSAVSRAYYCAYHSAKEISQAKLTHSNHIEFSETSHEKVIKKMLNEPLNSPWRALGYQLRDLKTEREEADYKLESEVTHDDAVVAIAKVKKLLDALDKA